MNDIYRNLSLVEVYHKLEDYNKKLGELLLQNDLEEFQQTVEDFIDTGIKDNPQFESALIIYRTAKPHYFIEGIPSDLVIQSLQNKGYFQDVPATFPVLDDTSIMQFAALTSTAPKRRKRSVISQEEVEESFEELIDIYDDFIDYKPELTVTEDFKFIQDEIFFAYLSPMKEARSRIDCHINFNKFAIKGFDTEKVLYDDIAQTDNFSDRLAAIEEVVTNVYDTVYRAGSTLSFHDFFEIDQPYAETKAEKAKYSERQFFLGLSYHHAKFTDLQTKPYPKDTFFYLALAMFFSIPTTNRIEAFMNKFGFTLNSYYEIIRTKEVKGDTYHFYGHHFRKWLDSGIDYFLIYELLSKEWGNA